MTRVKGGYVTRRRRKRVLKAAKGYFGCKSTCFKTAKEQVMRARQYAYRDRKTCKRRLRRLWIMRINIAARLHATTYRLLISQLATKKIILNRKMLSEMAVNCPQLFSLLVQQALQ